ncbi:large subunit GTPase 1 homolog isoform X2 [Folsomia candida]|uniref:large subunit GTPase 1 homolog isoform X2 n=1 Tax=Folsomia candida TaxID=158441 RepID=UPI001604B637|nr:large subunit GTPase 1 homolog isoform X2 [Folsomia candida]
MGRTRKTAHASLGMSLVKKKKAQWDRATNCEHPILTDNTTNALKSVTEENSYDEFIATATLANKEFTAEKLNVKFVALSTNERDGHGGGADDEFSEEDKRLVVVPRRPKWTKEMTGEELDIAEREAFLEWRRRMAHLQNKEGITPFERNIEVWRQLWRVVERSHIIVQIVDGRNPLLYRCEDLESYVSEMGKKNVLLINKADFLTPAQRAHWSQYFNSIGLSHAFYSAAMAALKPKKEDSTIPEEDHELDSSSEEDEEEGESDHSSDNVEQELHVGLYAKVKQLPDEPEATRILTREQLIDFLRSFKASCPDDIFAVGLVGYPNVGKSSTINSLMDAKKTSVSATPGKTKHFQTLYLEDDILLCDCPGLVMPAFGGSKGEMVLGGILPIDQLTSYHSATELLVSRIPMYTLEKMYGVTLCVNYSHEDFLTSYAAIRGFMTVRGIPDCSRASRIILKDYVNGKLCYCVPPPNVPGEEFNPIVNRHIIVHHPPQKGQENIWEQQENVCKVQNRRPIAPKARMERNLDRSFFAPTPSSVHIKGKQYVSTGESSAASSSTTSLSEEGKPWKKHGNRNKKEKLRRLYRHLDVE